MRREVVVAIDTSSRSSVEQASERVLRDVLDFANRRDVDGMQKFIADSMRFVNPVTGPTDKQGMRGFHTSFFAGIPDIHYEILRVLTDANHVVAETRITGTHKGELMGMPPTGRQIDLPAAFVVDVADDKVAEWHAYFDTATMLRQLGVMQ
jgi:steroid delta-isomerase-like uncharacterized protein